MSTGPDWLTPADVVAYLDLPAGMEDDDNLLLSTAVVKAAVEGRRQDLWSDDTPAVFAPGEDVKGGAVMWAGIVYQTRNAPSGFSGYGDDAALVDSLGARRAEVMRLLGWNRPVIV